ncbi:hypothetical protein Tco_0589203 [Tanacetum coccineum]
MHEVILFYNGLEVPTRQILDSKGDIPSKTTADAKVGILEMAEYSQKWHNGTSRTRSTKTLMDWLQFKLNSTILEGKSRRLPLKEEGKTLEEAYYTQFGGPFQGGGSRAVAPGLLVPLQ